MIKRSVYQGDIKVLLSYAMKDSLKINKAKMTALQRKTYNSTIIVEDFKNKQTQIKQTKISIRL